MCNAPYLRLIKAIVRRRLCCFVARRALYFDTVFGCRAANMEQAPEAVYAQHLSNRAERGRTFTERKRSGVWAFYDAYAAQKNQSHS